MAVRLFVGNLPYSATEAELREHFGAAGAVSGVWLPLDRETGKPRGFAFVEYEDRAVAEEAVRKFNNQPFGGRPISVNEARPPERTGAPPPRRPASPGGYTGDRPSGPREGGYGPRPMGGPPGGGGFDPPPEPGAERVRDRSRSFGPDAIRKKGRKGGRGDKGDKARGGPKQPLQVTSTGRVFWDEDEDHSDELDVVGEGLDAEIDDVDEDLDEDLDDDLDGEPDAEVGEGSAESKPSPDADPDRDS
ncbi:MAG: hypothetical protein IPF53_14955 [Blastocatellia bacterium]|nr:hypothetical protein [Blastocatellia bacterium]